VGQVFVFLLEAKYLSDHFRRSRYRSPFARQRLKDTSRKLTKAIKKQKANTQRRYTEQHQHLPKSTHCGELIQPYAHRQELRRLLETQ